MAITNKTSELATIIANQFENSRLQAEAIDPELGRHKFDIGTTAPNLISIQVPKVVMVDNYTDSIFSIIISIIEEAKFEITEPTEIHIYGPDKVHIDGRTVYPTSKEYLN